MDSLFSTLSAPLQQVITHYFYKVVEIEDQTIKHSFGLILNILIGYVLLNGITNIKKLFKKFKNKYFKGNDYIDLEDFDFSEKAINEIKNYAFNSTLNKRMLNKLYDTLKDTKINYSKSSKVSIDHINGKSVRMRVDTTLSTYSNFCMPVYRYDKNEYVWIIDSELYSKDLNAMENYYSILYNHKITGEENEVDETNTPNLSIFTYSNGNLTEKSKISPDKTFNKLFFREKENLINALNKFSNGNLYPKNLGLDNKLGILLYGPPGTGKTGTITAIANLLKRNIITYNNISSLLTISSTNASTSILVLDEFDYILNRPSEIETEKKDMSFKELELRRKEKNNDEMNMFLKFLDGLESVPNRVIVATTNYPEKINPVFLRPGRFDLKLELSYCDSGMFENIIKTVYSDFIFDENEHVKYINKDLTPLTLINSLAVTDTLEDCLKKL